MADKKISELPLLNSITGSTVVLPIVHDGTTHKVNVGLLSLYASQWSAKTGSSNTFTGTQTINGNLDVSGMITAQQYNVTYVSSSVQYQSGSTKFGDTLDDTHTFTGTLLINGLAIGIPQIMAQTASQDGVNLAISLATSSINNNISSFNSVFSGISSYTSSNENWKSGIRGEVNGLEVYTASLKSRTIISSSTQIQNYDVFALNSNLYQSTGSLIGITNGLMAYTSSNEIWKDGVRGELSAIEAWTASLDNTYATDAQLHQLYQATQSLNTQTGSQDSVNLAISTYTGSNEIWKDGVRGEVSGIEAYTASLKGAAIVSSSNQIQNYDVFALNSNLYESTGSIKAEIAGIEEYTASLKSAAIVSSSQQIKHYYTFAQTSSANTFYGNQSIIGSIAVGTETPSYTAHIRANSGDHRLYLFNAGTGSNDKAVIQAEVSSSSSGNAYFAAGRSGAVWSAGVNVSSSQYIIRANWDVLDDSNARLVINQTDGDVKVKTGNLVIGTAGKGIDFSQTSNGSGTTSSELLNDYEEGTFTPTFTGVNLTITNYGNRTGHYTKVGRLVTVTIHIMTEGVSAVGSESVKIGGLPFTSANIADTSNSANIFNSARWNANPPICAEVALNSTEINLYSDRGPTGAGTDPTTAKSGDMATGAGNRNMVRLTATYFV